MQNITLLATYSLQKITLDASNCDRYNQKSSSTLGIDCLR